MAPEVVPDPNPPALAPPADPMAPLVTPTVAEHAQSFGPEASPPASESDDDVEVIEVPTQRDGDGKFRHRAASQMARPNEVAAINQHTKELRNAQEALGIKRQPGESSRLFNLRANTEMVKALQEMRKRTAPPVAAPPVRPVVPTQPGEPFTEQEPTLEQFADKSDPYAAWVRAVAAWDRRKDSHDIKERELTTQTTGQLEKAASDFKTWGDTTYRDHLSRMNAYVAAHPEVMKILDDAASTSEVEFSPIMTLAVHEHERGPEMLVFLASHPDYADELVAATANQSAFDQHYNRNPLVATTQRRLVKALSTSQAGTTGSAATSRPVTIAPRPLNPVRTVPQTPNDAPPGEGSIADHARAYGPQRRR